MIRQALELSDELRLFSSPWSPPKWMKTNGRMDKGRYLRKDCRQVWADYFVRFLQEYEKEGIRIWGVTIQNEARAEQGWESCYYTAQEALDGVAVHWYAGDHFSALDAVHQMYPDKLILATEACVGPGCCAYTSGEKYAHDIIGNVNHWAGGWVDWNMILDDTGRPDHWMDEQLAFKKRFEESGCDESALSETEREFLLPCVDSGIWRGEAPVVMDHETKELHYSSSYYYMGHFSKFVRPGAVRIANSIYTDKLEVCAFVNPDGSIAAIAMNPNEEDYPLVLRYHDEIASTVVPAHSIVTYVF